MGAKAGLLAYCRGDLIEPLRRAPAPDPERTAALVELVRPGCSRVPTEGTSLDGGVYPPEGVVYAASTPGVDLVCDRSLMIDNPSRLPSHLVEAGRGRRLVRYAVHSVVDWLAFAVWEDGRLVRSLSLAPEYGVLEDIGDRLPCELPYWAGEHPVEPDAGLSCDDPYPLPFHPLDLGE